MNDTIGRSVCLFRGLTEERVFKNIQKGWECQLCEGNFGGLDRGGFGWLVGWLVFFITLSHSLGCPLL